MDKNQNRQKYFYKIKKYEFKLKYNPNNDIYKLKLKKYNNLFNKWKINNIKNIITGGGEYDDTIPISHFVSQTPSIQPTEIIPITNKDNLDTFIKNIEHMGGIL